MDETGVVLLQGDARLRLQELEPESVHLCVCSPPYHGLRDYGTGQWEGGDEDCDHLRHEGYRQDGGRVKVDGFNGSSKSNLAEKQYVDVCGKCGARRVDQQIGLEASAGEHIAALVEVFALVKSVLRKDGCLIVNYGDCYNSQGGHSSQGVTSQRQGRRNIEAQNGVKGANEAGLPAKNLLMLPSRLAIALQADGWILRSMIPWLKRNPMPSSVTDRPGCAVEYVFIFSRSQRYFWDADAVRRPPSQPWRSGDREKVLGSKGGEGMAREVFRVKNREYNSNGRNLRNSDFYFDSLDLAIEATRSELAHLMHLREKGGLLLDQDGEPLALDVNPQALADAHFASFPEKLVAPLIQAGSSEYGCCSACLSPCVRVVDEKSVATRTPMANKYADGNGHQRNDVDVIRERRVREVVTVGWQPTCKCQAEVTPACILDPFCGSGTTLKVATKLGRRSIGIELSSDYLKIARKRNAQLGLML